MDSTHEKIKEIKAQLRLYMNGAISKSMRDKGMNYKLNFGIEYPRIKEIALQYEKNHNLAQDLWKENIRECKIMAGLLQPVETFYPEIAEIWIDAMDYPELAEYTVMNLFQHLPYAGEIVYRWMADERERYLQCGFLLMARLLMRGMELNERGEAEFIDQALASMEDTTYPVVRKAAATALKKYGLTSPENSKKVLRAVSPMMKSVNAETAALATSVKDELAF